MVKGITFDFWNTVLFVENNERLFKKRATKVHQALAEAGYNFEETVIADLAYEVWKKALDLQYQEGLDFTPKQQVQELVCRLDLDPRAEFFSAIYAAYTELFLDKPPQMIEGVRETLEALAPYFRIGLICNTGATPGVVLRQLLKNFQLDHFFAVTTFSNEEGVAKPNPKIFCSTLAKLGVEPGSAVHIGDDPITDVGGARGVGMKAAWFSKMDGDQPPDYTWRIESLRQLPGILIPLAQCCQDRTIRA
jgi:putative hydrolase of the HAD superfamily